MRFDDDSAIKQLFDALSPPDGSEGDLSAAANLAPHAWEEIHKALSIDAVTILAKRVVGALESAEDGDIKAMMFKLSGRGDRHLDPDRLAVIGLVTELGVAERVPIIQPGEEWEAAVQSIVSDLSDRKPEVGQYTTVELLHRAIDAVEAVRYAGDKPRPVIDRPEA